MAAGLDFGILGPLEVRIEDGSPVALGGLRQRALLAVLVLHANEVMSTDRLIDELWGEQPPATAVHTVQVFVSRLRGALGSAGSRLVTQPPGYLLEVGLEEVDAEHCKHLYTRARGALAAGDPRLAAGLLGDALALWRGPPLVEFTYEAFAQASIARLEELRLGCREELVDAELALGRHAELVSDLEAMVREQPFRERPRGQLMLALYRCGRQADALDAFQETRRMLVEQLAVEPSQELRELEQAILRQDPALQVPSPAPAGTVAAAAATPEASAVPGAPAGRDMLVTDGFGSSDALGTPDVVGEPAPWRWEPPRSSPGPDGPSLDHSGGSPAVIRTVATVIAGRIRAAGPADPELLRALLGEARSHAKRVVARHGGAYLPGLGGEIVGVFGVPRTHEDDAVRALRAAEELRTCVADLSAGGPVDLVVHVGADTGEVVAETPEDVFGEPLSAAIAFMEAAGGDGALISEATRRLTSEVVLVDDTPRPGVWRLVGLAADTPTPPEGWASPMVGRRHELAEACAAFARAVHSRTAHLLTVIGDAGIGKSRLGHELADELATRASVLYGRCLSYGEGVALWPLREAVTQFAGGESREEIHALLRPAADADVVTDILVGTLGLAEPAAVGGDGAAEQIPWAFRRLLETLAERQPVLLVLDDSHWAEDALLELVDHLVDWLPAPMLIVVLARPELLDARPRWGGGHPRIDSLVLRPLPDEDANQLLQRRLAGRELPPAALTEILHAAEGNPLFVEQLLEMAAEDPSWRPGRQMPPTIQSLLAARLDRLGPGERAVIEHAAVIGREFPPDAVVELLPAGARASAAELLRALIRRQLIQPGGTTMFGRAQLLFQHILIRDVAYRTTSKAARGELHERFAHWLLERGEGYDEFVGYHLEQAFGYRCELGRPAPETLDLAARAGKHLATAGRRALSRSDVTAGITLMRRAADLIARAGRNQPDILLDLGVALTEAGDFDHAERVLETALAQAHASDAAAVEARAQIELSYQWVLVDPAARVQEMLTVADEAKAVFQRVSDEAGMSRAWQYIGEAHWTRCRCAEMEEALAHALTHAERAGGRADRSRILSDLASATVVGPRPVADGIAQCHAILERADGNIRVIGVTETMLAVLEAMDGRFDDARTRWELSRRRLNAVGLTVTVAVLQMYAGFIELMARSPERARPELADAFDMLERIGDRHRLATTAAVLARLLYDEGRYEEAERYARVSEDATSPDDVGSEVLWRGVDGKLLARRGEPQLAEAMADAAVALATASDFVMLHADARSDRAQTLWLLGRPVDAAAELACAITLYERKGMSASAATAVSFRQSLAADLRVSAPVPGRDTAGADTIPPAHAIALSAQRRR